MQNNHFRFQAPPPEPAPSLDRSGWSDAAIAAEAAAWSLADGRYQLGLAFARIAFEASHNDVSRGIPDVGAPVFDRAAAAQADLFGNNENSRPLQVPPSARCVAMTMQDGVKAECHGVIAWDDGTANGIPHWYHINHELDDHAPMPPAADTQTADQGQY